MTHLFRFSVSWQRSGQIINQLQSPATDWACAKQNYSGLNFVCSWCFHLQHWFYPWVKQRTHAQATKGHCVVFFRTSPRPTQTKNENHRSLSPRTGWTQQDPTYINDQQEKWKNESGTGQDKLAYFSGRMFSLDQVHCWGDLSFRTVRPQDCCMLFPKCDSVRRQNQDENWFPWFSRWWFARHSTILWIHKPSRDVNWNAPTFTYSCPLTTITILCDRKDLLSRGWHGSLWFTSPNLQF